MLESSNLSTLSDTMDIVERKQLGGWKCSFLREVSYALGQLVYHGKPVKGVVKKSPPGARAHLKHLAQNCPCKGS